MAFRNQDVWASLQEHQRAAIERGGSTTHEGVMYSGEDFGIAPNSGNSEAMDAQVLNRQLSARIEELETALSAQAPQPQDLSHYEAFVPNSKSEIEALSVKKLKSLAAIRGVTVEGDDKAAYVAALVPQEGA